MKIGEIVCSGLFYVYHLYVENAWSVFFLNLMFWQKVDLITHNKKISF